MTRLSPEVHGCERLSRLERDALSDRMLDMGLYQRRLDRIERESAHSFKEDNSPPPRLSPSGLVLHFIDDGRRNIDADQRRVCGERRSSSGRLPMLDDPPRFIA